MFFSKKIKIKQNLPINLAWIWNWPLLVCMGTISNITFLNWFSGSPSIDSRIPFWCNFDAEYLKISRLVVLSPSKDWKKEFKLKIWMSWKFVFKFYICASALHKIQKIYSHGRCFKKHSLKTRFLKLWILNGATRQP